MAEDWYRKRWGCPRALQDTEQVFHRFLSLPKKVRKSIWTFALPGPRAVFLKDYYIEEDNSLVKCYTSPSAPPALLFVSQEAQSVYTKLFGILEGFENTWFDIENDTLLVDLDNDFHNILRRLQLLSINLGLRNHIFESQGMIIKLGIMTSDFAAAEQSLGGGTFQDEVKDVCLVAYPEYEPDDMSSLALVEEEDIQSEIEYYEQPLSDSVFLKHPRVYTNHSEPAEERSGISRKYAVPRQMQERLDAARKAFELRLKIFRWDRKRWIYKSDTEPPSFPSFLRMPKEIQLIIWKLSLPGPRIIRLRPCYEPGLEMTSILYEEAVGFRPSQPPPVTLFVCHEASNEARKVYSLQFRSTKFRPETWFCPDQDTLFFDIEIMYAIRFDTNVVVPLNLEGVKYLMIDFTSGELAAWAQKSGFEGISIWLLLLLPRFSNLKRITVVVPEYARYYNGPFLDIEAARAIQCMPRLQAQMVLQGELNYKGWESFSDWKIPEVEEMYSSEQKPTAQSHSLGNVPEKIAWDWTEFNVFRRRVGLATVPVSERYLHREQYIE